MEYDHPNALEFLRKDCLNVNNYFRRRHSVAVLTGKELFDFVTDLSITGANIDDYLSTVMKTASERSSDDVNRLEADEAVSRSAILLNSTRYVKVQMISEADCGKTAQC